MNSPSHEPDKPDSPRLRVLHVYALSWLAFAQPLLDLLGRTAEFFVIRRIGPLELVAMLGLLLIAAPLPLAALSYAGGLLGGRPGRIVHGVVVAFLSTLIALRIESSARLLEGGLAIGMAAAAGVAVAILYSWRPTVRSFVSFLAPALLIVPVWFAFQPGVRHAVFPPEHGGAATASGAKAPIVFLVFDGLAFASLVDEKGMIDATRYPNIARLAGDATWYRNAHTVADTTNVAIPAMLTSRFPRDGALPLLADHPVNMFTLFGDYTIWADEPITRLCPAAVNTRGQFAPPGSRRLTTLGLDLSIVWLHLALPPSYRRRLPSISNTWEGFAQGAARPASSRPSTVQPKNSDEFFLLALSELSAGHRVDRYRQMLAQIDPKNDRALYFQHVMLPHVPWEYLPSGRLYDADKGGIAGLVEEDWLDEPDLVRLAAVRFLMQVEFLDRLVGELLDMLERNGMYDESLVVLVADHGASFRPGDKRRAYSPGNVADIIPVPLIIKAPGQKGGAIVDEPVSTLDILPTMMDILGVKAPATLEGRSTRATPPRAPPATMRISTKHEGSFDVSVRELDSRKYDTVRMFAGSIGPPSDPYRFGRLGRHNTLLGKPVSELRVRAGALRVAVEDSTYFQDHDPEAERLPCYLTASVVSDGGTRHDLALAVNGTIVATGRTSPVGGPLHQFHAILPEDALRKGFNDVRIYQVIGAPGAPAAELVLEETSSARRRSYSLLLDSGGRTVGIAGDGGSFRLGGALSGYAEGVERKGEFLKINGWAADVANRRLVQEVVVFYRNQFVTAGATLVAQDHVARALGDPVFRHAGFSFDVPASAAPQLARYGLRLFALSDDGNASELGTPFLRLESGTEGEYLLSSSGMHHPIDDDSMRGAIEAVEAEGGGTVIRGWSTVAGTSEASTRIVVVFDGIVEKEAIPEIERPDVKSCAGGPSPCGFALDFTVQPSAAQAALANGRARIFAVSTRRSATQLRVTPAGGQAPE